MTITKFLTAGGPIALAASLAFSAFPASARDDGPRIESTADDGQARGARAGWGSGDNGSTRREAPQARSAPQMQQQVRPAPQPQRQWAQQAQSTQAPARSGQDGNRGDNRSTTAQDRSGRDWNRGGAAPPQQARQQPQPRQQQSDSWNGRTGGSVASSQDWQRNGTYASRDRNQTYTSRQAPQTYPNGYRSTNRDSQQWDRRWRDNSRYNWYAYRNANRSVYRLGSYYAPYRNYSYRRLSIGFFLDNLFYSNRYWINNPGYYRLPDVYGPYRWVRYYDDALLVDVYSGQVVDVIYNFFW